MRKLTHSQLTAGTLVARQTLRDTKGHELNLPCHSGLTHLQFRRYSGCAVCNLHLQNFIQRHQELCAANIQEIVIFNSSRERILDDLPDTPFPIVADPGKTLYMEFGVETSPLAVFNPSVWLPALRGAIKFGVQFPRDHESMNGLPADFLIDSQGEIIAAHYGKHAYDQWSLDEVLAQASSTINNAEKEGLAT